MKKTHVYSLFFTSLILFSVHVSASLSRDFGRDMKKIIVLANLDLKEVIEALHSEDIDLTKELDNCVWGQVGMVFQENYYSITAKSNLERAERFIASIKTKESITEVVPDKLYYEILVEGEGEALRSKKPLVHLHSQMLEDKVLVDTFSLNKPVIQDLEEAIVGFVEGIQGIKVGEKRRLYIHPELAYGDCVIYQPNALIIIEVQLVANQG